MRLSWRHSVRGRLTLWNTLLLALLVTGTGIALYVRVQTDLVRSVDQELAQGADWLAVLGLHIQRSGPGIALDGPPPGPRLRPPGFGRGLGGFPDPPDRPHRFDRPAPPPGGPSPLPPHHGPSGPPFGGGPGGRNDWGRPRLLTTAGEAWGPYPNDRPFDWETLRRSAAGETLYSTVEFEAEPVRVYSRPVTRDGSVEAVIQAARPLREVKRIGWEQLRTLLTLIPLALLAAGLLGVFMTNLTLRPVRRITQAAAQIGAADLSRRLEVTSQDEFGELAATFNGMIGRLEGAFTSRESAYRQLEAAYEQQRRFTADASHELRTPLTRIKGSASLALAMPRTAEEYRKALQVINQAADAMNGLIQDLLLLARADAGRLTIDPQPVPVADLFQRAAAAVAEAGGAHAARECPALQVETPEPPLAVRGSPGAFARLLTNLLTNALRHTPADGTITLSAREEDGAVVITVADTGEGIPPEHLPHVCERFYRVDAARTRAQGGAGLGLAICRGIAEAHGGTLSIESELGRGTTVRVGLPRAEMPQEE